MQPANWRKGLKSNLNLQEKHTSEVVSQIRLEFQTSVRIWASISGATLPPLTMATALR